MNSVMLEVISENVGFLLIPEVKVLYLRLKSIWAVEMKIYVHWTCIYVNKENVYP